MSNEINRRQLLGSVAGVAVGMALAGKASADTIPEEVMPAGSMYWHLNRLAIRMTLRQLTGRLPGLEQSVHPVGRVPLFISHRAFIPSVQRFIFPIESRCRGLTGGAPLYRLLTLFLILTCSSRTMGEFQCLRPALWICISILILPITT